MLWLTTLLPIITAVCVLAASEVMARARVRRTSATLTGAVAAGGIGLTLVAAMGIVASGAASGAAAARWHGWGPVLEPTLQAAGISRTMMLLVPLIALPVVVYAARSQRDDPALPRLLALLCGFTGVMELLVTAADLLTLLVAWELAGAVSYALIGFQWREEWRVRSARSAFLITRTGDLGLYLAAAALFTGAHSLSFQALAMLPHDLLALVAAGLLLAALSKSAQLPFSPWLFSAMAGPTPASALLHSATMVAAGAYLLARLEPVLIQVTWFGPVVAWTGVATALAGGVVALIQTDLKKSLAASTSAQYGFMFVAIGAGVPAAAGVHLVTHAALKALLFLGAGIALHATGTLDVALLQRWRLGARLPRVALLFGVGTLALAAVPPLGAALSKELIVTAAVERSAWLGVLVLLAGLLSVMYAARLQLLAFWSPRWSAAVSGEMDTGHTVPHTGAVEQPPSLEIWSLALLALLSLAYGVLWLPAGTGLARLLGGGPTSRGQWWEVIVSLGIVLAGVAGVWWLIRRGLLATLGLSDGAQHRAGDWLGLPALAELLLVRPALRLAHALATIDNAVVDAGVRAAAAAGAVIAGALAWWGERQFAAIPALVARGTAGLAHASMRADDGGVDAAVEQAAREVGLAGSYARRLQTGLAHQYYVGVAVGLVLLLVVGTLVHVAHIVGVG